MKPHEHKHEHAHGHQHSEHHQHASHARFDRGLLMSSSIQRVLGALGLIAVLWLAVTWAVGD